MSFSHFLGAVSASPTEKMMHAIHEVVGWAVLALVATVLVTGAARSYFFYRGKEVEFTAAVEKSSLLRAMRNLLRSYLRPTYRKVFVDGAVRLCSSLYRGFEVGVVDRLNYAVASLIRQSSVLLHQYVDVACIDGLNYFVAGATKRLSDIFLKHAELGGIDRFNYLVVDGAVGVSSRFRKTHTGVLSYNMVLAGLALVAFLVLSLYVGGFVG